MNFKCNNGFSRCYNFASSLNYKVMKKLVQFLTVLFLISILFTGCEAIEGIFKAGMGVGIFLVLAIIVVVVFVISKFTKK